MELLEIETFWCITVFYLLKIIILPVTFLFSYRGMSTYPACWLWQENWSYNMKVWIQSSLFWAMSQKQTDTYTVLHLFSVGVTEHCCCKKADICDCPHYAASLHFSSVFISKSWQGLIYYYLILPAICRCSIPIPRCSKNKGLFPSPNPQKKSYFLLFCVIAAAVSITANGDLTHMWLVDMSTQKCSFGPCVW